MQIHIYPSPVCSDEFKLCYSVCLEYLHTLSEICLLAINSMLTNSLGPVEQISCMGHEVLGSAYRCFGYNNV